jgi:prepilin-type N-terminal cleavage/methylation domain-containing protein
MNEKGVTLVEFLMVTVIIGILLGTIFAGYRGQNKELVLQRVASKMVADIEKTREMSMSAQADNGSYSAGGYGIHFRNTWSNRYAVFADIDSNRRRRNNGDEDVNTIYMEENILITSLNPSNQLDVVFVPPSPDVYIEGVEGESIIRIAIDTNPSKFKEIVINNIGLIYVR